MHIMIHTCTKEISPGSEDFNNELTLALCKVLEIWQESVRHFAIPYLNLQTIMTWASIQQKSLSIWHDRGLN